MGNPRGSKHRPRIAPGLAGHLLGVLADRAWHSLQGLAASTMRVVTNEQCGEAYAREMTRASRMPSGGPPGRAVPLDAKIRRGRRLLVIAALKPHVKSGRVEGLGAGKARQYRLATPKADAVALDALRTDGGTQPREEITQEWVDDYAAALGRGDALPPVEVVFDGVAYWLWDGFHRYHAHRKAGRTVIAVRVTSGTQEDARWLASSANKAHDSAGSKRTNADKRRAVEMALRVKWGESDRAIAEHVGVSDMLVGKVRRDMAKASSNGLEMPTTRTVTRAGQTYTQDTTNIGKGRKPKGEAAPPAPAREEPPRPPALPPPPVAGGAAGVETPAFPAAVPFDREEVLAAVDMVAAWPGPARTLFLDLLRQRGLLAA